MRKILFRGKSVSDGEWVYGVPIIDGDRTRMYPVKAPAWEGEYDFEVPKVIPETVGQYTGLQDKNGEKIFEGDMVKYSGNTLILYEVVMSSGAYVLMSIPPGLTTSFRTLIKGDIATSADFAVMGNIHDEAVTK